MKADRELVDKLRGKRAQSVVITSVPLEGEQAVVGYDKESGERFFFPMNRFQIKFDGRVSFCLMTAELLGGKRLKDAGICYETTLSKMLTVNVKQLRSTGVIFGTAVSE